MSEMRWEYFIQTLDLPDRDLEELFDSLGKLRWELVSFFDGRAVFKRFLALPEESSK